MNETECLCNLFEINVYFSKFLNAVLKFEEVFLKHNELINATELYKKIHA